MPSLSDLDYTDNMASNKKPLLTDLRESLDSIETYINNTIKNNLLQLAKDAFPASYAFDSDGNAQYTNNLYEKQTATDTDTSGDHTISTTGAWTDLDATNASLTFTPELQGDFKAAFQFNVESVTSNATNETDVRFRLTDGSDVSDVLARVKLVTGASGTTNTVPVKIEHIFSDLAASSQTIKLQYYIVTTTATTIKVLANSNDPIAMSMEKI